MIDKKQAVIQAVREWAVREWYDNEEMPDNELFERIHALYTTGNEELREGILKVFMEMIDGYETNSIKNDDYYIDKILSIITTTEQPKQVGNEELKESELHGTIDTAKSCSSCKYNGGQYGVGNGSKCNTCCYTCKNEWEAK